MRTETIYIWKDITDIKEFRELAVEFANEKMWEMCTPIFRASNSFRQSEPQDAESVMRSADGIECYTFIRTFVIFAMDVVFARCRVALSISPNRGGVRIEISNEWDGVSCERAKELLQARKKITYHHNVL